MKYSRRNTPFFSDDEDNVLHTLSMLVPDLAKLLPCHSPQMNEEWYPEDRFPLFRGISISSTDFTSSNQWSIIYNNLYHETTKRPDKTTWESHQQIIIDACSKGLKKHEVLKLIPLDYEKWPKKAKTYFKTHHINNVYEALKIVTIDDIKLAQNSKKIIRQYIDEINITLTE